MNIILVLAFLFYIGSIAGWVLELFFRKIVCSEHKWINPGFLTGPYLPLYGFGCIIEDVKRIKENTEKNISYKG